MRSVRNRSRIASSASARSEASVAISTTPVRRYLSQPSIVQFADKPQRQWQCRQPGHAVFQCDDIIADFDDIVRRWSRRYGASTQFVDQEIRKRGQGALDAG